MNETNNKNNSSKPSDQVQRLDKLLVELKLAVSRTQAQEFIEKSLVEVNGRLQTKSNCLVPIGSEIRIIQSEDFKYVSRGGLKLEGALTHLGWTLNDFSALDIGLSTGGFSDCLIKRGVKSVVGIDVGQNQLHESLRKNPILKSFEKINARDLDQYPEIMKLRPIGGWDLIVIDVSFISLTLILPAVAKQTKNKVLALVKPQFEVGKEGLSKAGIVKDVHLYDKVKEKIVESAQINGFSVIDYFDSPILGKDGNREFFVALSINQG